MMKIWRKLIIRLLVGSFFAVLFWVCGCAAAIVSLDALIVLLFVIDVVRLKDKRFNDYLFKRFGLFLKEKERNKFSTIILFFIGILLPMMFFEARIAMAAVLFLIYGDFFAEYIGTKFGRTKIFRKKSLEGSLACFVSCFIIGLILNMGWSLILVGSFAATLSELYSRLIKLDDNLTIGVISGLIMSLV